MVAFSVQTLLLMAAAYFLGAVLACLVRRSLHVATRAPVERRVDPLPEVAARAAGPARFGRGPEVARAAQPAPRADAAQPAAGREDAPQDLERIRRVDADIAARLRGLGVTRYAAIAAWMKADVARIGQALGIGGRISQENWIEQAQILAAGGETHYSARRARGEAASAVPTPDEGERGPAAPASGSPLPPLVSERAAFAGAKVGAPLHAVNGAAGPAPARPVRPAPPAERDDLQRIGGVSAELEQALNAQGVARYAEIAQWAAADVQRIDARLGLGGRIARENWIEQAQILGRGGDTRFSREFDRRRAPGPAAAAPPQAPARTDLRSLRSVRSQAYRDAPEPGPEAARRAAGRTAVGSGADDLKRIRGIGVLIEKRLNAMGVASYESIANWTADDIERVSRSLDFKGRIERENWVEQARILSAGGHTEFSRRVDRGEVETSRPKP
jgi:predicted flap endonuclease-1-like 5' DNA nuclease